MPKSLMCVIVHSVIWERSPSHHQQNCTTARRWWSPEFGKRRLRTCLCHCLPWWHGCLHRCEPAALKSEHGEAVKQASMLSDTLGYFQQSFTHSSLPAHLEWERTSSPHAGVWRSRRDRKLPAPHRGDWQTGQTAVTGATSWQRKSLVPPTVQRYDCKVLELKGSIV